MATIKNRNRFFEPDPLSQSLVPPLEIQYEHLKYCKLHDGVPEAVTSYFNAVVSLWLYGWLYYPFYTLADFLSSIVVEMALRERLPGEPDRKGRDRRGLKVLLKEAQSAGLLRDEAFPSLERRRAEEEETRKQLAEILGRSAEPMQEVPYADVLIESLPRIRNSFAHANMHAIVTPGMALDSLIVAAEIITQLWQPAKSRDT